MTRRRSDTPPLPTDWRASLDAYEAWHTTVPGLTGHYAKQAWQAAWEACTQHHGIKRNGGAHMEQYERMEPIGGGE